MTQKTNKAKPKNPSKAQLASALKKANIPLPESGKIEDMQFRLDNYLPGPGWLMRAHKNGGKRYANHPMSLLNRDAKQAYWIPNSEMANKIIATQLVLILGRAEKPSSDNIVIDVPLDYKERFGNGSNDR
tara:strand:- start:2278 stop:2667 length:390 start_codon:yes stop_codon:yes gene_type:complete